ncbi:MAG: cyclic nucleotide-binding domain-containing protein [Candidatus Nitrohelix vancouverensis]|uniref:Cyclic nucleotide-binding domain-containing protein n=1 Tax=Candidatus Nitrohelix vancouverensis TaxID=2705534 RepID=A0A7T0C1Q6_9BACT|nr:MAG: cyclic nucleotide-binding domain-containing protein [Candidatus Nitrohelix vancouverensis]
MKTIYFKKGKEIIQEGTLSDCAYIIETGKVEVSKLGTKGEKKIIGILTNGDIFGEMGLIDGLPRSATVRALEDCSINVLTQDTFNSMSIHNPKALMPILKVLASRLRATLKLVENLQTKNAKSVSEAAAKEHANQI